MNPKITKFAHLNADLLSPNDQQERNNDKKQTVITKKNSLPTLIYQFSAFKTPENIYKNHLSLLTTVGNHLSVLQ